MHRVVLSCTLAGCGAGDAKMRDATAGDADSSVTPDIPGGPTCVTAPGNLRGRWRAEMNVDDHLGTYPGLANGASFGYTPGKYGQAFLLDGVDTSVSITEGDVMWPAAGSFSLSAWFKTSSSSGTRIILAKDACGGLCPSGANAYFALSITSANFLSFDFRPNALTTLTSTTDTLTVVNNGAWHHVVGIRDNPSAAAFLYIDGALAVSVDLMPPESGPLSNTDGEVDPVTIGAAIAAGVTTFERFFPGAIDDVMVFHRALMPDEVAAMYNALDGVCL